LRSATCPRFQAQPLQTWEVIIRKSCPASIAFFASPPAICTSRTGNKSGDCLLGSPIPFPWTCRASPTRRLLTLAWSALRLRHSGPRRGRLPSTSPRLPLVTNWTGGFTPIPAERSARRWTSITGALRLPVPGPPSLRPVRPPLRSRPPRLSPQPLRPSPPRPRPARP
jgi:hypothetical protein